MMIRSICLRRSLPGAAFFLLTTGPAWSIGYLNTQVALPGDLGNNVVRIHTEATSLGGTKPDVGSGVVVAQKNDATGKGAWVSVLTADHVLLGIDKVGVGFGDGTSATLVEVSKVKIARGPGNDEKRVDLAVLSFRVADRTTLPKFGEIKIGTAKKDDIGALSGYGWYNAGVTEFTEGPSYKGDKVFGTRRTAKDAFDEVGVNGGPVEFSQGLEVVKYEFKAIRGTLSIAGPANARTSGDAFLFGGDSGGPTFLGSELVGIHSYGDLRTDNDGDIYADAGEKWTDVQLSEYKNFVTTSVDAVPEPASVVAATFGLVALIRRRRQVPRE